MSLLEGESGGELFGGAIAISAFCRLFDEAVSTSVKDQERDGLSCSCRLKSDVGS